jgi:hypothetical protein
MAQPRTSVISSCEWEICTEDGNSSIENDIQNCTMLQHRILQSMDITVLTVAVVSQLPRQCGILNISQPYTPPQL